MKNDLGNLSLFIILAALVSGFKTRLEKIY